MFQHHENLNYINKLRIQIYFFLLYIMSIYIFIIFDHSFTTLNENSFSYVYRTHVKLNVFPLSDRRLKVYYNFI